MFPSEEFLKLILAIIVGGLIGAEREFRHRAAGFRTIIFITCPVKPTCFSGCFLIVSGILGAIQGLNGFSK
jgi:uncharacterized membrane protein YhiD involved in acid resistance